MMRALLFSLVLLSGWAQAAVTAGDLAEIRAVIQRQIDAFKRADARGVCALSARDVRVRFLALTVMEADAVQQVELVDRSGAVWHAYYAMQRQKDGSWRTNGCRLVRPAKTIPT